MKVVKPRYDPETGKFKSLYEIIGYLIVRGSPEEVFFNYGINEKNQRSFIHTAEVTGTAYRLRAEKLMVILPRFIFSFLP